MATPFERQIYEGDDVVGLRARSGFAKSIIKLYTFPAEDTPPVATDGVPQMESNEPTPETPRMIHCFKEVSRNSAIADLLTKHDVGYNAFITHLDKAPIFTKILSFLLLLTLHAVLAVIILWRLAMSPYYFVGRDIEIPKLKDSGAWYWKPFHLFIDYFTWQYIWPMVTKFVNGELAYRLRFGFRRTEIIFREPKGWIRLNNLPEDITKYNACWANLHEALSPSVVYGTTGSGSSQGGFWSLRYPVAMEAHELVKSGKIPQKTFDFSVWMSDGNDWFVWRVWRSYDREAIRRGTVIFQNKLKALGKEPLFDQWQLMIQDGSDGPLPPLASNFFRDIDDLFRREGVQYAKMWHSIFADLDSQARTSDNDSDADALRRRYMGKKAGGMSSFTMQFLSTMFLLFCLSFAFRYARQLLSQLVTTLLGT